MIISRPFQTNRNQSFAWRCTSTLLRVLDALLCALATGPHLPHPLNLTQPIHLPHSLAPSLSLPKLTSLVIKMNVSLRLGTLNR